MRNMCKAWIFITGLLCLVGCQTNHQPLLFPVQKMTDASITVSVREALLSNTLLASTPVRVDTQEGVVSLSGYVSTIRQSDTAGDVATKVPGVKSVQNNLIVRKR